MDKFINQLSNLYQSALNWSAPQGYGVMPNSGTAINTSVPFDESSANLTTANSAAWFGAMQGSFNSSFSFLNKAFQQQQNFQGATNDRIYGLTSNFGQQMIDI